MKLLPLVLGVSLAANAALVVLVSRQPSLVAGNGSASVSGATVPAPAESRVGDTAVRLKTGAKSDDAGPATTVGTWQSLNAGDLRDMVARLRAAGFPAAAIRGILYARLHDQLEIRRKELMQGIEEPPYWTTNRTMYYNPKVMAAQRELYQEQLKIMRVLLGPDASEDNEIGKYYRRRQFGDISAEKGEELQRVSADYNELRSEIYSAANGLLMPEDREKITYLEKELRNDMARILTPAELENYELRSSSTANMLRSQLTTFQPTEEEFRALFRAARVIEDQYGTLQGGVSSEVMKQRQAAINEQAKLALSPERYAEFAQAIDPRYSMLNRIAARYDLPITVVPQVYAVQQEIQKRAAEVRALPATQRAGPLTALAQEATARISPLLGERGLEAYKIYGGQWLQQLAPASSGTAGSSPVTPSPTAPPKG